MVNVSIVINLLVEEFKSSTERLPTREEQKIVDSIARQLRELRMGSLEIFEKEEVLDLEEDAAMDPDWDGYESDDCSPRTKEIKLGPEIKFSGGKTASPEQVRAAIDHYRDTESGARPLTSMSNTFHFITDKNDLKKLRMFEKLGIRPMRSEGLALLKHELEEAVREKFERKLTLHDNDLAHMAVQLNTKHQPPLVPGFIASHTWLALFKKSVGIVSRRVTVWITKKSLGKQADQEEAEDEFVAKVNQKLKADPALTLINCDQSGFVKELHSTRTLSEKGEKTTERTVQSSSATTHSFTIMPSLTHRGKLLDKLFVQLQEPNGTLPQNYYKARNLFVTAGTSHIMTKATMKTFFKECVMPSVPSPSLLILDSWPAFKDHETIESLAPAGSTVSVMNIPPGATGRIQPLDVFFFRFMKEMYRRFVEHVIAHEIDYSVQKRDHILMMISAIFRIFSHPDFEHFRQYSWKRAGYTDIHIPHFDTPVEYAFHNVTSDPCNEPGCCEQVAFIRCPYCKKSYCFKHFVLPRPDDIHWCV